MSSGLLRVYRRLIRSKQLFKSCISTYGEQFTEQSLVKTKDAMFKENAAAFEMPDARLDLLSEMTVDGLPVDDLKPLFSLQKTAATSPTKITVLKLFTLFRVQEPIQARLR